MFGFLRPHRSFPLYRKAYARCCQIQQREFGITTLPALSYEAISLYLLCADAKCVNELNVEEPSCCRLRIRQETIQSDTDKIGKYCAAAGVLLLETKILDDIRDTRSLIPKVLRFWFRKKFRKSHDRLLSVDEGLLTVIKEQIESHLMLEREQNTSLSEYTLPTAKAFAELFSVVTHRFPEEQQYLKKTFYEIGFAIGQALIAYDCAADWWKDARRGEYNPVANFEAADEALVFAANNLVNAAATCRVSFGSESLMSRLLVTRAETLLGRLSTPSTCRAELEKRGFTREPGYTYAYCDGCDCDCGGCDGCGDIGACGADGGCCDGAGPEAVAGIGACFLPADCCCFCYEPACCGNGQTDVKRKSNQETTAPEPVAEIVGQRGLTLTPLSPSGLIIINNERHSASSGHGYIEAGVDVIVIKVAPYGLIVDTLESEI